MGCDLRKQAPRWFFGEYWCLSTSELADLCEDLPQAVKPLMVFGNSGWFGLAVAALGAFAPCEQLMDVNAQDGWCAEVLEGGIGSKEIHLSAVLWVVWCNVLWSRMLKPLRANVAVAARRVLAECYWSWTEKWLTVYRNTGNYRKTSPFTSLCSAR